MTNTYLSVFLGGYTALLFAAPALGSMHLPPESEPQLVSTTRYNSLAKLRALALDLVNRDRNQQGVQHLRSNPVLNQVAQAHAEDMIRQNYFSHYAKDGSTPEQRVRAAGGNMIAGENILSYHLNQRQRDRNELITEFQALFFNSASHRKIMLRSRYSQFGYGLATGPDGRMIAVQLFGIPDPH